MTITSAVGSIAVKRGLPRCNLISLMSRRDFFLDRHPCAPLGRLASLPADVARRVPCPYSHHIAEFTGRAGAHAAPRPEGSHWGRAIRVDGSSTNSHEMITFHAPPQMAAPILGYAIG